MSNGTNSSGKPLVIISYSKKDVVWKDDFLLPHLKALELAGRLVVWSDDDIDPGGKWYPEIEKAMKQAAVAVCLISENYLVQRRIQKLHHRHTPGIREC